MQFKSSIKGDIIFKDLINTVLLIIGIKDF